VSCINRRKPVSVRADRGGALRCAWLRAAPLRRIPKSQPQASFGSGFAEYPATCHRCGGEVSIAQGSVGGHATPHGELMTTILAGLATFERHLIKARTDEGVKAARARGVRFGRPPKLTPFQRQAALQRLADGESQADVARAYNVDPAAICRLAVASSL
jgi:Resolvase, N terminal domain